MSSNDSITTVFKCMLKGAADFLIKPVRRNELKNLWQHVWRRISVSSLPYLLVDYLMVLLYPWTLVIMFPNRFNTFLLLQANNASGVQSLCGGHCKAETSSKSRGTRNCSDSNVSTNKKRSWTPEKAIDAHVSFLPCMVISY